MMKREILLLGGALLTVVSIPARADIDLTQLDADVAATKKIAAKEGWQGSVSLGYLATTGNTNTRSLNGQTLAGYKSGPWQDVLAFQAIRSSQDGVTSAESYDLNGQSDYNLSDKDYVYGTVDYLRDTFSGYRRRTSEIVGYGRRLLNTDTQQLALEFGAGVRQTYYTDDTHSNDFVERLALNYLWQFADNSNLSESLSVINGTDNTFTQSVTALTTNLVGSFALSVSYTVKHNTTVLPGIKNTDTITAISLVYTF